MTNYSYADDFFDFDDEDEARVDAETIALVKKYEGNISDDEARSKIGYILIKAALKKAYFDGVEYGKSTCGWSD